MSTAVFLTTVITLGVFMFGSILALIWYLGSQMNRLGDRLDTRIDGLNTRLDHLDEVVQVLREDVAVLKATQ